MEMRDGTGIPTINLNIESKEVADFNYLEWSGEMIREALDELDYKDELTVHRHLVSRTVNLIQMTAKAKDGKVYYMTSKLERPENKPYLDSKLEDGLDK
jgi:hypothetical protein